MKSGDMVRFALWEEVDLRSVSSNQWHTQPKPHIGILIEYDKLMKLADVLFEGKVYKLRSVFVEKAGAKDIEAYNQEKYKDLQRD